MPAITMHSPKPLEPGYPQPARNGTKLQTELLPCDRGHNVFTCCGCSLHSEIIAQGAILPNHRVKTNGSMRTAVKPLRRARVHLRTTGDLLCDPCHGLFFP